MGRRLATDHRRDRFERGGLAPGPGTVHGKVRRIRRSVPFGSCGASTLRWEPLPPAPGVAASLRRSWRRPACARPSASRRPWAPASKAQIRPRPSGTHPPRRPRPSGSASSGASEPFPWRRRRRPHRRRLGPLPRERHRPGLSRCPAPNACSACALPVLSARPPVSSRVQPLARTRRAQRAPLGPPSCGAASPAPASGRPAPGACLELGRYVTPRLARIARRRRH